MFLFAWPLNKKYKKLKILASGEVKTALNLKVDFISKQALSKLEKAGGNKIKQIYDLIEV